MKSAPMASGVDSPPDSIKSIKVEVMSTLKIFCRFTKLLLIEIFSSWSFLEHKRKKVNLLVKYLRLVLDRVFFESLLVGIL